MTEIEKQIINIVFASGEGMSVSDIIKILKTESMEENDIELEKNLIKNIDNLILNIKNNLNNIGLELIVSKTNGGQFLTIVTQPESSTLINSYFKTSLEEDLTPAQLQTLTIVAYLTEVTVQEVSFIRGVQSMQTLRALSTRGLVKKISDKYFLTLEAFKILGISNNRELKDFQKITENLKSKLSEALNG